MDGKVRQMMKLIWCHKKYRRLLGMHPFAISLSVVLAAMGGLVPLLGKVGGEEIGGPECVLCGAISAFWYLVLCGGLNQRQILFTSGKSLLGMPYAKEFLTKGVVMTRLTSAVIMMPITLLGLHLCKLFNVCEKVPTDDLILLFGIAYCIAVLTAGLPLIGLSILCFTGTFPLIKELFGMSIASNKMIAVLEKAYAYDMPWWLVAILVIVLFVGGTFFGMKLLERTYEKRRVAIPLEQRVAQQ